MRNRFLIALLAALLLAIGARIMEAQVQGQSGRPPSDSGVPWATYGTKTDTTALTLQAAPGAARTVYVYMAYCLNTSASTATTALIKVSTTAYAAVPCPAASKWSQPTYFYPPLALPPNSLVSMNVTDSATTAYLFAAGTVAR